MVVDAASAKFMLVPPPFGGFARVAAAVRYPCERSASSFAVSGTLALARSRCSSTRDSAPLSAFVAARRMCPAYTDATR